MAVDTQPDARLDLSSAPRGLDRLTDQQLIARFRAGDEAALDVALRRHERKLLRFARRILGSRSPNAEDVVQEAMLRTSLVLRRGDRAIDLGPWLYKLVRNCALDELARVRAEVGPLDAVPEPAAHGSDPADVSAARSKVRDTLADVAALPDLQRHALLRREVEGATHADVAGELGITEPASRLLVLRARANLVKARAGRDARCDDIRDELLLADDAGRRASAHAYRHLATCGACRDFRASLKHRRHDLRVLSPVPFVLGGLVGLKAAGAALLPGGGSAGAGAGAGAKLATAGAVTAAVAGGTLGIDRVFGPGDPAPVTVSGPAVPGGEIPFGAPLPPRTAVVTRTVAPDPALPVSRYAIDCPPGLRVAGLAPTTSHASHALAPETIVGASTRATVLTEPTSSRATLELAIVCKQPGPDGSVLADPVRARAAAAGDTSAVCVARTYLRARPGARAVVGSLTRRQPVAVTAEREGWRKVTADTGAVGWVRASVLC